MPLLDLRTAAMIAIVKAWLDQEREQPLIRSLPLAGPLLEKIGAAYKGLVAYQNAGKQEHPDVRELMALTTALDTDHDRYTRSLHAIVSGIADMAKEKETADGYRSLRAALFPTGLDINRQSYVVQAGEPTLREGRLTAEHRELLETTCVKTPEGQRSLRDLVDQVTKVAHALGEAEAKKKRLQQENTQESSRGPARRAFARIVSHFVATLELEDGLSPEGRRQILEPLESELRKAAQARARAKKKGVAFDPDAEEVEEA